MLNRLRVDNSGQGNCMYYAYSISLMYFLRKKNDRNTTELLFNRLRLSEPHKNQLHLLLENKRHKPFTRIQIAQIIEPILGPATRRFAAEQIKQDYMAQKQHSDLFAAINYAMIYHCKGLFEYISPKLATLLKDVNFNNHEYTEAEIFRVKEIILDIKPFIGTHAQQIINDFNSEWPAQDYNILEDEDDDEHEYEHELIPIAPIQNDAFKQQTFLEDIIGRYTLLFFRENDFARLNTYVEHINTNFTWGTTETLLVLHNGLQGEQRNGPSGAITIEYEVDINLHIYKNGISSVYKKGVPDMILNNLNNMHWLSFVDANVPMQRNDLLEHCAFNSALKLLHEKAVYLKEHHPLAAEQAFTIYTGLRQLKKQFIEHNSMSPADFAQKGQELINSSPKDELNTHRGIGKLFNIVTNALLAAVTLGLFNIIFDRFYLVNPVNTDSMNKVNNLQSAIGFLAASKEHKVIIDQKPADDMPESPANHPK